VQTRKSPSRERLELSWPHGTDLAIGSFKAETL
jgi:hypothetical protein